MKILESDYNVILLDLPGHVRGFIRQDDLGFSTIYINARLNHEAQKKTLLHELRHISAGHIGSGKSISEIEFEAHLE